jgi:TolB-like protein
VRTRLAGGAGASARPVKLAVLPFANLSADPEQDYLSDGLTQELIAQLGRLHPDGLAVIARTSIMRYQETKTPIDQIGRELDVDYVLEGSARREANRLRVTAELIGVRDQTQLWADTFERELSGVLVVQSEVARRVASALAFELLPAGGPSGRRRRPGGSRRHRKDLPQQAADEGRARQGRFFELALARTPGARRSGLARSGTAARTWDRGGRGRAQGRGSGARGARPGRSLGRRMASAACATSTGLAGGRDGWRRALELDPNAASEQELCSLPASSGVRQGCAAHRAGLDLDPPWTISCAAVLSTCSTSRRDGATRQALGCNRAGRLVVSGDALRSRMRDQLLASQRARIAGDPQCVAAFEQGLAEGGYEGAQRHLAELLAARYEASEDPDAGRRAVRQPAERSPGGISPPASTTGRSTGWRKVTRYAIWPCHHRLAVWDPLRGKPRYQACCDG